MAFVYLPDLRGDEEDWVIRVRVCRMWESISTKDGSLLSMDMILADEKVCRIPAPGFSVNQFLDLFVQIHVCIRRTLCMLLCGSIWCLGSSTGWLRATSMSSGMLRFQQTPTHTDLLQAVRGCFSWQLLKLGRWVRKVQLFQGMASSSWITPHFGPVLMTSLLSQVFSPGLVKTYVVKIKLKPPGLKVKRLWSFVLQTLWVATVVLVRLRLLGQATAKGILEFSLISKSSDYMINKLACLAHYSCCIFHCQKNDY